MPRTSVFLRNSAWLPSVVCGRAGAEHCLLLRPVHSLGALPTAARRCTSTARSSRAGRGARPATSRPPHMLCTSCPASRVCLQLEGRCTKRLCLRLTRSQPSLLRRAGAPRRPGRPAPVAVRAPQHPARHTCFVHPAARPVPVHWPLAIAFRNADRRSPYGSMGRGDGLESRICLRLLRLRSP